jgi:hypothetical protein
LIRALANIRASVQDKACDLQEQRIMAQIVLHPQLIKTRQLLSERESQSAMNVNS